MGFLGHVTEHFEAWLDLEVEERHQDFPVPWSGSAPAWQEEGAQEVQA